MKLTRKLTAMVLVICLMIPWCTTLTVTADANPQPQTAVQSKESDEPFRFGRSILEQMDNSDALLYAYDQLVYGCETLSARVDISHRTHQLNSDEATVVWETVASDYPLFFWLAKGVSLRSKNGIVTSYGLSVPADAAAQIIFFCDRVFSGIKFGLQLFDPGFRSGTGRRFSVGIFAQQTHQPVDALIFAFQFIFQCLKFSGKFRSFIFLVPFQFQIALDTADFLLFFLKIIA